MDSTIKNQIGRITKIGILIIGITIIGFGMITKQYLIVSGGVIPIIVLVLGIIKEGLDVIKTLMELIDSRKGKRPFLLKNKENIMKF